MVERVRVEEIVARVKVWKRVNSDEVVDFDQ